ncbi:MAG: response regulator transcription factor [Prevotellaceae bacterium]|nr:response regulator transcription factor [Candidatus Minthosoma caballi]
MAKRILIVDDEPDILEILRFNLEMEGYDVFTAEGADEAQEIVNGQWLRNEGIDLILLDVMMTPKSGFEWARELKANARTAGIPIIFCTAKTAEDDLLTGFGLGSDDYICKPFRISEVKARVRAVLRRSVPKASAESLEREHSRADMASDGGAKRNEARDNMLAYEGLMMDLDRIECTVDGKEVPFTKLEFELLTLLLSSPGQVFSREKILQTVWPNDTVVLDRTVDVNITRIRKKIGRYGECIRTKFGYGYLFEK